DGEYPYIAQDAGIIAGERLRPATAPARVVNDSASEDQSLCWSPNGKWIAFHSHKDQSDDIWLRPSDSSTPPKDASLRAEGAEPRRISFLGRGAETGWPRWSPDGQWLLFDGANRAPALSGVEGTHESVLYVVGIDQESGA